jgi:hypothetical protein
VCGKNFEPVCVKAFRCNFFVVKQLVIVVVASFYEKKNQGFIKIYIFYHTQKKKFETFKKLQVFYQQKKEYNTPFNQ